MHPFKELQRLAPKYARQMSKMLTALGKIADNTDPKFETGLIEEYETERKVAEEMGVRFRELIELDKEAKAKEK